ncbi:MAG: outer membrane beta-barrel protein [Bacteroidota bacterium]
MKQYWITSLLLLFLLPASSLLAQQGEVKVNLGYTIGLPLGDFKTNYIPNASPRGFMGDLSYGINNRWAIGLGFGYQDFYHQYDRTVYDLASNKQISAVLTNSIQTVPLIAKVSFTPMQGTVHLIQPYLSAGAGISLLTFHQYLGEFSADDNRTKAKFTAMADAGFIVPFHKRDTNTGFQLGVSYNYTRFGQPDAANLNTVGIHAGLVFQLHN